MKSKYTKLLVSLLLFVIIGTGVGTATVSAWDGSGTELDPYRITSPEDLAQLAENVNAGNSYAGTYFFVTENLDLSGYASWTPIGVCGDDPKPFQGVFDGGNRNISNLVITGDNDYSGLFGYVSDGAVLRNVHLADVDISSEGDYVGGLVGFVAALDSGSVSIANCSASGEVSSEGDSVGGLVGYVLTYDSGSVSIANCSASGEGSSGGNNVGGLIGDVGTSYFGSVSIANCSASGEGSSGGNNVGGLVGDVEALDSGSVSIANCSASGEVSSEGDYVGGLVGHVSTSYSGSVSIVNSSASGEVSGGNNVGGLVGFVAALDSDSVSIVNSSASGEVSGGNNVGGLVGYVEARASSSFSIANCSSSGSVSSPSGSSVGGLVGYVLTYDSSTVITLANCSSSGSVSSPSGSSVGGLVGYVEARASSSFSIANCSASGEVTSSSGNNVGGLVGYVLTYDSGTVSITNCSSSGEVSSPSGSSVGGLVGHVYARNSGTVTLENSVALNPVVSGSSNVGRIVGHTEGSGTVNVTNTYALSTMDAGDATDGINVSPAEAQTQSFYENTLGWDFASVWTMDASQSPYPVLQWQTGGDEPEATTVVIEDLPENNTVDLAGAVTNTLTAVVSDAAGSPMDDETVKWTSSNGTVLTFDAADGTYTAHTVGTTTITATAVSNSSAYDSVELTVIDTIPKPVILYNRTLTVINGSTIYAEISPLSGGYVAGENTVALSGATVAGLLSAAGIDYDVLKSQETPPTYSLGNITYNGTLYANIQDDGDKCWRSYDGMTATAEMYDVNAELLNGTTIYNVYGDYDNITSDPGSAEYIIVTTINLVEPVKSDFNPKTNSTEEVVIPPADPSLKETKVSVQGNGSNSTVVLITPIKQDDLPGELPTTAPVLITLEIETTDLQERADGRYSFTFTLSAADAAGKNIEVWHYNSTDWEPCSYEVNTSADPWVYTVYTGSFSPFAVTASPAADNGGTDDGAELLASVGVSTPAKPTAAATTAATTAPTSAPTTSATVQPTEAPTDAPTTAATTATATAATTQAPAPVFGLLLGLLGAAVLLRRT